MKEFELSIIPNKVYKDRNILKVKFKNEENLKRLFSPKLKYINFTKLNDIILVDTVLDSLTETFNDIVDNLSSKVHDDLNLNEFIELFNTTFRNLLKLASKDLKMSMTTARGLYGEMHYLKSLLEEAERDRYEDSLHSWRRPAPANHDFDFETESVEIKTISRKNTTLRISSEYQLEALPDKKLYLKCYKFDNINASKKDSLGIIFRQILGILKSPVLNEIFYSKCADDMVNYLGPELTPLDYEFILLDELTYEIDQTNFPRIHANLLESGISDVSYNLDLSMIDKFKVD
ncbi:PD-(D/E)XK motif protein [Bacteroidota bacterium]